MPEFKTIRNALITQFKNDTDVSTEFTTPPVSGIVNIDYGLPKKIGLSLLPKSIRVIQLGRGQSINDAEVDAEFGAGYMGVWSNYRFHVVSIFEESDQKKAEDTESDHDRIIRKAISKDPTLGRVVSDIDLGRTFFRGDPESDSIHFMILEVSALTHERADVR